MDDTDPDKTTLPLTMDAEKLATLCLTTARGQIALSKSTLNATQALILTHVGAAFADLANRLLVEAGWAPEAIEKLAQELHEEWKPET